LNLDLRPVDPSFVFVVNEGSHHYTHIYIYMVCVCVCVCVSACVCNGSGKFRGRNYGSDTWPLYLYFVLRWQYKV